MARFPYKIPQRRWACPHCKATGWETPGQTLNPRMGRPLRYHSVCAVASLAPQISTGGFVVNYFQYNDTKGRDARLVSQAKAECRARYLTILAEYDANAPITLTMTKAETQRRRFQGLAMHGIWRMGAIMRGCMRVAA